MEELDNSFSYYKLPELGSTISQNTILASKNKSNTDSSRLLPPRVQKGFKSDAEENAAL